MTLTYLPRNAEKEIIQLTKQFPAVAIVGPRQVGKTSLARYVADALEQKSIYLDLESPGDLNKLCRI